MQDTKKLLEEAIAKQYIEALQSDSYDDKIANLSAIINDVKQEMEVFGRTDLRAECAMWAKVESLTMPKLTVIALCAYKISPIVVMEQLIIEWEKEKEELAEELREIEEARKGQY